MTHGNGGNGAGGLMVDFLAALDDASDVLLGRDGARMRLRGTPLQWYARIREAPMREQHLLFNRVLQWFDTYVQRAVLPLFTEAAAQGASPPLPVVCRHMRVFLEMLKFASLCCLQLESAMFLGQYPRERRHLQDVVLSRFKAAAFSTIRVPLLQAVMAGARELQAAVMGPDGGEAAPVLGSPAGAEGAAATFKYGGEGGRGLRDAVEVFRLVAAADAEDDAARARVFEEEFLSALSRQVAAHFCRLGAERTSQGPTDWARGFVPWAARAVAAEATTLRRVLASEADVARMLQVAGAALMGACALPLLRHPDDGFAALLARGDYTASAALLRTLAPTLSTEVAAAVRAAIAAHVQRVVADALTAHNERPDVASGRPCVAAHRHARFVCDLCALLQLWHIILTAAGGRLLASFGRAVATAVRSTLGTARLVRWTGPPTQPRETRVHVAEAIASYVDSLMRGGDAVPTPVLVADLAAADAVFRHGVGAAAAPVADSDGVDATLRVVAQVVASIDDVDVVLDALRDRMARRLVDPTSRALGATAAGPGGRWAARAEAEHQFLGTLVGSVDAAALRHMQGMLSDVSTWDDTNRAFAAYRSRGPAPTSPQAAAAAALEATVLVASAAKWPVRAAAGLSPVRMHYTLDGITAQFERFYQTRHPLRRLRLVPEATRAVLHVAFPLGAKEASVSALQALLLLHVDGARGATVDEAAAVIADSTITGAAAAALLSEFKAAAASLLLNPRMRILRKCTANDRDASAVGGRLELNPDFVCAGRKIAVPLPAASAIATPSVDGAATDGISPAIAAARGQTLDAAAIRIMKSRRRLPYRDLVLLVQQQVRTFTVEPRALKRRVEDLIQREYLARDADDADTLVYLA